MLKTHTIRIIGGKWRGRKIKVLSEPGLRPTPDRVRETLFNWLAPVIAGARCLDLFAGSGALGFEALSRGADYVEMVDVSPAVIQHLNETRAALDADRAEVKLRDVPKQLTVEQHKFDIVFLDPPYDSELLLECCQFLEVHHFLAPLAYIYLEANEMITPEALPDNWQMLKSKRAGNVYYHLAQRK